MRKRLRAQEQVSHERWLVSYSDFMTLLFAFFVVLFAATYRDNQSIRKLARAIHNGFQTLGAFSADESGSGGAYSTPSSDEEISRVKPPNPAKDPIPANSTIDIVDLRRQLQAAMGKELADHEVVMQMTPEGFVISLKELGFFNSGQAVLLPGAAGKIEKIAKILAKPGLELRVEGHSDDQPIHTALFRSNWELSTARAMAVLTLLVDDAGFDPTRISASGYGQYRPVADNTTPDGRRMNRRVDLVVVERRETKPFAGTH
jgi:chemotaxis protein MotB